MAHNQELGRWGESLVAQHYRRCHHRVLELNWRCRAGEIDLIVFNPKSKCLVFVEVKTRSSDCYGSGAEAVGWAKQRRIRRLASLWLASTNYYYQAIRFDVALVDGTGEVRLIEGCF